MEKFISKQYLFILCSISFFHNAYVQWRVTLNSNCEKQLASDNTEILQKSARIGVRRHRETEVGYSTFCVQAAKDNRRDGTNKHRRAILKKNQSQK